MLNKKSKKYTWNLSPLYKGDNDPQIKKDMATVKRANYRFINKWRERDDYLRDPQILRQALDEIEKINETYGLTGKYGYYFSLRSAQDENNPKLKGRLNQISETATKIENDIQFFELKLAKVSAKKQKEFLRTPELKPYHHLLLKMFQNAKYLLTEAEEKIMNLKADPAHSQWVAMTSSLLAKQQAEILDETGKKSVKPFSEIMSLTSSIKKPVRDRAFAEVVRINNRYAEVAEAELNAIMLNKKIGDELRGLARPDTARHLSDDIETEVVDSLVKVVSENFPTARSYYRLKAKLFKTKKLAYPERNVPYGQIEKTFNWPASVKIVDRVLSKLDPEFGEIFQQFVDRGQIDVFPSAGKSGGAFCAYNLKSQPTYILLNHAGKLPDVLTLAHEVGHGLNDELMRQVQPPTYFSTPLATAEVASTFIEDFVLGEIMAGANDELRLSLLLSRLNDEVSTIFRQIAAYRFEQDLHQEFRQQGYLAKEAIGQLFRRRMNDYLGPAVDQPAGTENFWVYWSHFRSFFYVYSYASGLLISKTLQAKVRQDPAFMTEVKKFLQTGSADSPKNIFRRLGIDISQPDFWQIGLNEIKASLKETEKLAKKLGRI